jgi:PAS domain S-box-containing protein
MQALIKRMKNQGAERGNGRDNIFSSMVVFGIGVAITYWALDTFLHIFFSDRFNVLAQIVGQDLYEIYIRLIVLCLFIIFGSHAQYTINIRREAEEELREYRDHLEELVKERTAELVESNTKLKQEVLERKRSEIAHRESEEKYRLLVENANDAIFIIQDGKVTFPNPKAKQLSRDLALDLDRVPFFEYIHSEDKTKVLEWYKKRLKGNDVHHSYSFKLTNQKNNEIWVELNAVLINWENRIAALNFLRDISAQKKLENQFLQSQRMESIGTLAGGIAHDFNNLLMGIQGNTSVSLMDLKTEDPLFENLKSIERCVKSGANLTKQLLGFARGGKYVVRPTYLNEVIDRTSNIFGRTRKQIKIHRKYLRNIWMVNADVGQIEQVLLNLYVNGWQAMPEGGNLYLATENVVLDADYIKIKPYYVEPGNYVKISVTDTGTGMDKKLQQRIFEPFFTTKEVGTGTGLGLASAYGIIKNHGGLINCYSEKGHGTTFNIYLPAIQKAALEEKERVEITLRGSETILLVDDEALIVDVSKKMIEGLGYEVLPAKSGDEALKIYQRSYDRIDIVILDMIMPYLNGGEVYKLMKEINPEVKVLLSSGYSLNGQAESIMERGCNGFIQKPFDVVQLSQKIREVLDEKPSPPLVESFKGDPQSEIQQGTDS